MKQNPEGGGGRGRGGWQKDWSRKTEEEITQNWGNQRVSKQVQGIKTEKGGKGKRIKDMTRKKETVGQYRCQPEEEIIALFFLLVFLSLPCSLCLILSGVRPPDFVAQTERKRKKWDSEGNKEKKGGRAGTRKLRKGGQDSTTLLSPRPPLASLPLSLSLSY